MKRVISIIENPKKLLLFVLSRKIFRYIPDSLYLHMKYKLVTGEKLNINTPHTYNEKLQWLKLYDRNPLYTDLVDKVKLRKFIEELIGIEYLVPIIGVFERFEEIEFEKLPNQFVLKCNHDSAGLIICKDKTSFDINEAKIKIENSLKTNYFYSGREWPYKNVKPKIICEKYLTQDSGEELRDYRFFCFHGKPKFITVDYNINNKKKTRRNLYDLEWNLMEEEISYEKNPLLKLNRPKKLSEMIAISKKISKDIPHCRVDFYYVNSQIIVSEITFFHQSGMGKFRPYEFGVKAGNWINLSKVQK